MPSRRQPARMKLMSNSALWAARGRPFTKDRKAVRASLGEGASESMASVMPVRPMISGVRRRPGFTKVWNRSVTWPFFSTTAPISVMASRSTFRPVVSISKQTISSEKSWSWGPWTAMRSSKLLTK